MAFKYSAAGCCCGCSLCNGGGSGHFQLDLASVANQDCTCTDFNGSYILRNPAVCNDFFGEVKCGWQYGPFQPVYCAPFARNDYRITMGIYSNSTFVFPYINYVVEIRIYQYNATLGSCAPLWLFRKNYGATKPVCSSFNLLDIPYAGTTIDPMSPTHPCHFETPGATAKLTYIA